jgi:hypothetical protein
MRVATLLGRVGCTALVAVTIGACFTGGVSPSDGALSLGTWGGDNAGLIATDSVTHVHIGCTFGDVKGRIPLDRSGQFAVTGSYVLRAYPIMVGPSLPARFFGRVDGTRLTLSIAVTDTVVGGVVNLGPVTVRLGQDPTMGPCPICRVPKVPVGGIGAAGTPPEPMAANPGPRL